MPDISHSPDHKPQSHLRYIAEHFDNSQMSGQGYKGLCPVHGDKKPSLSINVGKDDRILVKCFAGCRTEDVLNAVGLRMADLMPDARYISATYDYQDEDG